MVIQSVISSGVVGHLNSGIAASKLPTAANVTVGWPGGLGGAVGGIPIAAFMSAMRSARTIVLAFPWLVGFQMGRAFGVARLVLRPTEGVEGWRWVAKSHLCVRRRSNNDIALSCSEKLYWWEQQKFRESLRRT